MSICSLKISFTKVGSIELPTNINLLYIPDISIGAVNHLIVNFRKPVNRVVTVVLKTYIYIYIL